MALSGETTLWKKPNQVLLTFDIEGPPPREDYFDDGSLMYLNKVLDLLEERGLRGIFFVTGLAAEKIDRYREVVERLRGHQVSYHSSLHSVRPGIIEYTDLASYVVAVAKSLERETSHVNPETGEIEGEGGILALKKAFPKNCIVSFRAPFLAWSPPHLEALKKLGIKVDFSSQISDSPLYFKGIKFYPPPIWIDGIKTTLVHRGKSIFLKLIDWILLRRPLTVLAMHPSFLLVKDYFERDKCKPRGETMTKMEVGFLELLFERIKFLRKMGLIEVTASFEHNCQPLDPKKIDVRRAYLLSIETPKRLFNYNPRFVFSHFLHFFDQDRNK